MGFKPTWPYKKNLFNYQSYKPSSRRSERHTHVGHVRQMSDIAQQTWRTPVTRNHRSAKAAGTRFETAIASALAQELDDDRIERRAKTGAKDRGDIGGLRIHGQRMVIECKDTARMALPQWVDEAHTEAGNDDALVGIVIHKRRGVADPGKQWVAMTVDDLLALLTGERHGHRKDFA